MLPAINFIAKRPIVCVFEVTRNCNSRCGMCHIWERKSNTEMKIEEMKTVFSKLKAAGVYEVYVQGGEPLLHPEIKKILLLLNEGFEPRLITNGILLNESFQDFIIDEGIGVTVSLDTM